MPAAARRTIFECNASRCAVFRRRADISSLCLSVGCKVIGFFGRPERLPQLGADPIELVEITPHQHADFSAVG